jgi:hypothetical protein
MYLDPNFTAELTQEESLMLEKIKFEMLRKNDGQYIDPKEKIAE